MYSVGKVPPHRKGSKSKSTFVPELSTFWALNLLTYYGMLPGDVFLYSRLAVVLGEIVPEDIETLNCCVKVSSTLTFLQLPETKVNTHQAQLACEILIRLSLVAQLEQRVVLTCRICILIMQAFEVLSRRWIDDLLIDLPAYVGVVVQDAVVR
jgi:hypothetical protein